LGKLRRRLRLDVSVDFETGKRVIEEVMEEEGKDMKLWEKVELSRLVIAKAIRDHDRLFASCSFGKDSRVLVDLVMQVEPRLQFIGIDTGYEFPETLAFAEELIRETGMNFRWVRPPEADRRSIEEAYGDAMILDGRYKCCEMKTPAIAPVLREFDGWMTGLRRDENDLRKETPVIDTGRTVKINAIAFWTREDVWNYITGRRLRYHPLYDAGYPSLGCRPCTSKGLGSERAGRFAETANQGLECGLHLT
jgi:phosphoadenosine phosphosulfate reductase